MVERRIITTPRPVSNERQRYYVLLFFLGLSIPASSAAFSLTFQARAFGPCGVSSYKEYKE